MLLGPTASVTKYSKSSGNFYPNTSRVAEARGRKTRGHKPSAVPARRILWVSRISSYTSKVCSICQHEAASDSDNDVRFLAPNGKDFRIDKILA